ncbi:porin [Fluviicola sp.]|uniref:porin n=1 Tax=Fluviicola sp. TaxID=1917219 RepID=UPI0031E2928B
MNRKQLLLAILLLCSCSISAQDSTGISRKETSGGYNGIRLKLDESGQSYLRMNIWTQFWLRTIENNPGTAVNKHPEDWTLDAGMRRMRIQIFGQVSPRFLLMLQLGSNNQSFASGGGSGSGATGTGKRPPIYFHDAYGQFILAPEVNPETKKANRYSLSIGAGLHCWNGVSRLTNASTIHLLTADAPIFNWPTIEMADQITRMFGVFAKGNLGKLGYRISVNKPFMTSQTPVVGGPAVDNNRGNIASVNGYFSYQFLDRDEVTTPFLSASYYGKKKVLNVGAGVLYSPNSTMTQPVAGVFESHSMLSLGADVFCDLPVGKKEKDMTYTLYSVFYYSDFGKDYLRTTAVMNPGMIDTTYTGVRAMEGVGNSRFLLGTGEIWYTQTAWMLPKWSSKVRFQPYAAYTWKKFMALNQPGQSYNLGINLLFEGNHARISLDYGSRPLYSALDKKVFKRAGEFLIMTQFWL